MACISELYKSVSCHLLIRCMNEQVYGCEVYLRRYVQLIWTLHFFRNQISIPVKMYNFPHFPVFLFLSFYVCSLCHIFCVSILYVRVLFISEHVSTVQFCLHISYKHIHVLLRDTMDESHIRLLWHSLYWVNSILYCKNLSRIEVWTARGRSVRGMCRWKDTVAFKEKILVNNAEWLCGVFRLCVYRYLRLLSVTRLSHWSWYSSTAKRIVI